MTEERRKELTDRYMAAGHKMQSGVALKMNLDATDCTPKHLRVGVNSAMVNSSALGRLLIVKGLIDEEEYLLTLAEGMEAEAEQYEREARAAFGPGVTLE